MIADLALRFLWVAAHHGLRRWGVRIAMPGETQYDLWRKVHSITTALGNPPAPGGPR